MMPKTLVEAMSPTLSPDEVFQAFEELIGSGSEMDAVQAADFISQQNGMDREQVYAILKADEEEMAHQFGGSEAQGQPCDHCGSENTTPNESMPSMMGYGHDDSWKCNDCGKTSFSTPLGESLKTDSFDKFMDKITIQESHNANRKMIVEDSAMRKRAARHQERPAGRTRWSR